jgi:CRISPR/Cas system-associated exonuclease Cas4 (RecB family)
MKTLDRTKIRTNQLVIVNGDNDEIIETKNFKNFNAKDEFIDYNLQDYLEEKLKVQCQAVERWLENEKTPSDSILYQDENMRKIWIYTRSK